MIHLTMISKLNILADLTSETKIRKCGDLNIMLTVYWYYFKLITFINLFLN